MPQTPRRLTLAQLTPAVLACRRCPRLARHHHALRTLVPAGHFLPVPGVGNPRAKLWIVGLAPGARGAGLTGIPFTRDASGRFLRDALRRANLTDDDVFISNALRCVPPDNRPTSTELTRCRPYLQVEWDHLLARVVLALGKTAWDALQHLAQLSPRAPFAHGGLVRLPTRTLLASYHVSPLNVNTHRLTPVRFDRILRHAVNLAEAASVPPTVASG